MATLKRIQEVVLLFAMLQGGVSLAQTGVATLVKMPRQTGMGGAGVGLADDEFALFMNPAGLAGQETRRLKLLGLGLEAPLSTFTTLSSSISGVSNFSASTLNQFIDKEIYVRSSLVPMVTLPHFAITYLLDVQGALSGYNLSNPSFQIGNMITHGVQAGMGWSLKSGRKSVDEWRIGLGAKMLWRRGGYFDVNTAGFLQLSNGGLSYINQQVGSYGVGYGADVGVQYLRRLDRDTEFSIGGSVTDIGGVRFSSPQAQAVVMNPSVGIGYSRKIDMMKLKLAADLRNLDQDISFSNKTHMGAELSLPVLKLYGGLNQFNLTFGAAVDLWIFRLSLFSFSEELGVQYHQVTSRRYMLQVDFSLPI
jgi:hypothetical protein